MRAFYIYLYGWSWKKECSPANNRPQRVHLAYVIPKARRPRPAKHRGSSVDSFQDRSKTSKSISFRA